LSEADQADDLVSVLEEFGLSSMFFRLVHLTGWFCWASFITSICALPALLFRWAKVEDALRKRLEAILRKKLLVPATTPVTIESFSFSFSLVELRGVEVGNPREGSWSTPYVLSIKRITIIPNGWRGFLSLAGLFKFGKSELGSFVMGYRFRDCNEIQVDGVRLYLESDTETGAASLTSKTANMMSGKNAPWWSEMQAKRKSVRAARLQKARDEHRAWQRKWRGHGTSSSPIRKEDTTEAPHAGTADADVVAAASSTEGLKGKRITISEDGKLKLDTGTATSGAAGDELQPVHEEEHYLDEHDDDGEDDEEEEDEDEDHLAHLEASFRASSDKATGNHMYQDIVGHMKATYNAKLQRQASIKEKTAFAQLEKGFRESSGWKIGRLFLSDFKLTFGVTSTFKGRELILGSSGWTLLAYVGSQARLTNILMMGEGRTTGLMATMIKESGKAEIKEGTDHLMARAQEYAKQARDVKERIKGATTRDAMKATKELTKGALKKYLGARDDWRSTTQGDSRYV